MRDPHGRGRDISADISNEWGAFIADCGSHERSGANAELIVRCVNSHDALVEQRAVLVEALQGLMSHALHSPQTLQGPCLCVWHEQARAALQQAGVTK